MEILKKATKKERALSNKRVKFNINKIKKRSLDNTSLKGKKKKNSYDNNSLESDFPLKLKKENSVKKRLLESIKLPKNNIYKKHSNAFLMDQGKYFMKKILQIKREINKNEFSNITSESNNKKLSEHEIKKIGTDLRQSLMKIKFENGFGFSPKSIRTKSSKINSGAKSPKLKKISDNKNKVSNTVNNYLNLNQSNLVNEDLSNENLLMNKNNSKLELLNKEEINNKTLNIRSKTTIRNKPIYAYKYIKTNRTNVFYKRPVNEKYRKLMNKGLIYDSFDDEEEFEDQINKDFYIMPNSIFIIILDILIAFHIFYYITYNPYYIASETKFIFSNILSFNEIYHFFMDIIFILDFLIQFVRAYYDFDENLITNNRKIIFHYLTSWFFIDLITMIPIFTIIKLFYEKEKYIEGYDFICNYSCQLDNLIYLLCYVKLLKFIKVFERNQNQLVSFIWSKLSNTSFIDNWGAIIFQVSLAIFCLHITACFHIIIGRNSYPNWITEHNLTASNFNTIYITSIYFLIATTTSVGYGDITGSGLKEHIFLIFLLIIGIIAYSWLVSSVSNYVIEKNKDNVFFSSKVSILDEIKLAHPKMDKELYNKIYLHLKQLKLMHKKKDKNILLESLPYNLRNSLLYEINKPLIEGLNFFKNFHNSIFILSAVTKLIPIVTNKGDIIIEQDEIINSMVFVKQGRLGVEIAIDMNNINYVIDSYINGTFILDEENERNKNIPKVEQCKKKDGLSLMSTLNYTMDDSFILNKDIKNDFNFKRPLSFRKRLLKFMEKKYGSSTNSENKKVKNIKRIKYVKLYYIRKGEHFGEIFMFLNKPSSFTLRVKSPKAELLLLKKIDAIEISSNYPNIWKRLNKKSFKNLIQLKDLVSREMIKFCGKNGIKYDLSYKMKDLHRSNSLPDIQRLEKNKIKNSTLTKKFKNFKKNNKSSFIGLSGKKEKKNERVKNKITTTSSNLRCLDTKFLLNENRTINSSLVFTNTYDKNPNNNQFDSTPYREDEINDELYSGEVFIENMNQNINFSQRNNSNEKIELNLFKYNESNDGLGKNKKSKNINKLINSSRGNNGNNNKKLFYHKASKSITKNKTNYNFHYNINNSISINQIQESKKFNSNQLFISKPIIFKIGRIYDNLNAISKGNYKTDFLFQKKIKSLMQSKYNINNNSNLNDSSVLLNFMKKLTRKETKASSMVTSKNTFFKKVPKFNSLIKENEIKNEQIKSQRRKSLEFIKKIKINKDDKSKREEKDKNKNSMMLNKITKNIRDGDQNLNNPNKFYNDLFVNIIQNKNTILSSSMIMKNIQFRKTIKNKGNEDKKISKKASMLYSMTKSLLK